METNLGLIKVQLVPAQDKFNLDQYDLEEVFEIFGKIEKILIKPKGEAFILFSNFLEAFFA